MLNIVLQPTLIVWLQLSLTVFNADTHAFEWEWGKKKMKCACFYNFNEYKGWMDLMWLLRKWTLLLPKWIHMVEIKSRIFYFFIFYFLAWLSLKVCAKENKEKDRKGMKLIIDMLMKIFAFVWLSWVNNEWTCVQQCSISDILTLQPVFKREKTLIFEKYVLMILNSSQNCKVKKLEYIDSGTNV